MLRIMFFFVLAMLLMGATMQQEGYTKEQLGDIQSNISYDNIGFGFEEKGMNQSERYLSRAVFKYADALSFIAIQGANEALEYGYENPKWNYNLIMKLIIISLFAPLVIPLIYLILFIVFGVIALRDWIKKKKGGTNGKISRL